jgi:hypothetical protein
MKLFSYAFTFFCLITGLTSLKAQQIPIGQWRDELPYTLCNSVTDAGDKVYCSTPYAVFYLNKEDNSVSRITKINGLSDIGISCINYNKEYNTLVIAYTNANIDLVVNNTVTNISDIKRKPIIGNKTINSIFFIGKDAYLSCGFGIVILDISKEEIRDTYYIGKDGSQVNVMAMAKDGNDSLFAATDRGLYKAWLKDPNLANFASWHKDTRLDTTAAYTTITYGGTNIVVNKRKTTSVSDSLYLFYNGNWVRWEREVYPKIMKLESNSKYLLITYEYYVQIFDKDLNFILQVWNYYPGNPVPLDAIADASDKIWIADTYSGMISYDLTQNVIEHVNLSGPLTAKAFSIMCNGSDLYIAPGGRDASFIPLYNVAQVYHFNNTNWNNIAGYNSPLLNVVHDIVTIAVDPFDSKHMFAGSYGKGLLEFYNDSAIRRFTEGNSTLRHHTANPDTSDIRVGGVTFDASGNLWVVTSHNNSCLSMKRGDQWIGFTIPIVNENDLGQILIDRSGQKWILMRYGNMNPYSILVFTDRGTPENPADDEAIKLNSTVGNGNIPGNIVYSIAEDKDGEIWVGTEKGIAVFYSPENIFTGQPFDAQRILVEQGGYVQYLLENETATAIAVDGGNRKWIGTDRGGVFLFSDDGTKEIYHFTAENSPLLSNRVTGIAIDNITGEVYFATDKGVISFKSTATGGGETNENVFAYPNPVREGYDGYIAIKGLVNNAQVRITDISGKLIFSTKAEGGQAIWNGQNFDGRKAQTGVYLVFAANEDGSEKVVTKILVIN